MSAPTPATAPPGLPAPCGYQNVQGCPWPVCLQCGVPVVAVLAHDREHGRLHAVERTADRAVPYGGQGQRA